MTTPLIPTGFIGWLRVPPSRRWRPAVHAETEAEASRLLHAEARRYRMVDVFVTAAGIDPNHRRRAG